MLDTSSRATTGHLCAPAGPGRRSTANGRRSTVDGRRKTPTFDGRRSTAVSYDSGNSERIYVGRLYVVATPIGNLEDITLRALRILREVPVVAAEDTRVTRTLFHAHDIHTPLVSFHEFTTTA